MTFPFSNQSLSQEQVNLLSVINRILNVAIYIADPKNKPAPSESL
jgi:hypothetical protein